MRLILLAAIGLTLAFPALAQPRTEGQVSPLDRLVHEQLLVLDTHLDTPALLHRPGWDIGDYHHYDWDVSQVDIPRMAAGGLDGGFFVIYTRQGPLTPEGYAAARDGALLRAAEIQRMVAGHADVFAFATKPEDAARIAAEGKRFVYQSIENSYPLGADLGLLQSFYQLGVRMAGPVHSKNNQFADSATDTPRWNGLSPLGRAWVAEMNRLGMLIDASHASDAAFDQMLALSRTPIILSHSGPKAMFDHPRNIDDERMRKLARAGGVMQINSVYLEPFNNDPDRTALRDRQEEFATLAPTDQRKLLRDAAALDAKRPYGSATFDMFMKSLLHAIKVMGVDHVGIGADWDGGGGVIGMEDVTALPKITARLRQAGYGESDIAKIWGGNALRVLGQAQAVVAK
ncbi:MAG: peptidase [Alphaproteobacteria bacterium]|nr:peptidase [Alphaproteobacteria bacterium]